MKDWIAFGLAMFAAFCVITHCVGCSATSQVKEAAAESAYLAEHMKCVDQYDTKQEIDACRASVRLRWGIAETVTTKRDGGTP